MAKRADSTYRAGRSRDWIKLRHERTGDFVIVGCTEPKRGRVGLGALHLGAYDGETLRYVGRVGTGLNDKQLAATRAAIEADRRATPPFDGPVPGGGPHLWCEPRQVCEVRFKEWTEEHLLRQPVFLRFRDDKRPEECELPARANAEPTPPPEPRAESHTVPYSNLDKVFWPDEGYTKGDLIEFYRAVAPWLLHYLRDRPVVMTRYPDGIGGKSFFQKDAPAFAPSWLRTERMWSEHASREIDYFIVDDEPSLLYVVNLGTIPLHVWASRVQTLERPDWCILDLDPKGAPFSDVIAVAKVVRELCEEIELPSYPKTSGSTGLHVLIPLGRLCTFDQARSVGELLARAVVARVPEIATIERVVSARAGKVYVDYLQNGHGKLIAAPLAARPVPGALVSTPLEWREVGPKLDPKRFTIETVPARLRRRKHDPLAPVVDEVPDLPRALERLAKKL
jgi:bifunctional non-homologous end joining protein LigD